MRSLLFIFSKWRIILVYIDSLTYFVSYLSFSLSLSLSLFADYTIMNLMWFWPASSLICGNKMPTWCNRGFYCRSYCLLNMFQAPLCPSSGAQKYYTVVADCGISCCGFQVVGLVWSWGLCVRFAGYITLSSTPNQQLENHSTKYHRQQPLYNTLELLMMGIVVPETCWASNKICNKNLCCIQLAFYFHMCFTFVRSKGQRDKRGGTGCR